MDERNILTTWAEEIETHGYAVTPSLYGPEELDALTVRLDAALNPPGDATFIRSRRGHVYAARNVLELWPEAAQVWRRPPVPQLLVRVLGPRCGLVRALYFDKPPDQGWWLPWHKDLTIAVRDNGVPSQVFCKPTRKAGVPHVEAPEDLLARMLTVRIHLDAVTPDNGPMGVLPGSHLSGKEMNIDEALRRDVLVERGGVLFIRPLVAHNSAPSRAGCQQHRRTLHLEFAARSELPDGYEWHDFVAVGGKE